MPAVVLTSSERVALERGALTVDVGLHPLRVDIRRGGRRLLRAAHPFVRDGEARDRFIRVTEGVVPDEALGFPERAVRARVAERTTGFGGGAPDGVELSVGLGGGREASLRIRLPGPERVLLELDAAGPPLRAGIAWDARPGEAFGGLGARHGLTVDHAGRAIQLGADRAYLGPDCPPELVELGGIPQGDYAPAPWLQSSRGYALWVDTHANGTRFDLRGAGGLNAASARAAAGPLRLHVMTDPTPAARLRRYLRLTGLPPVLPEWGYGFWKSRDVYPHQDDVLEDLHGCRWHGIPLDALVLDSPWETHYNTWEPNPHQFPDFAGMVARMRRAGVRTVVWVTPWTNLDAVDGQVPPDPGSQRLHRGPAPNYAEGAAAGHFVREANGDPYVARWWMGAGSPIDFTSPAAEAWWRAQAAGVLALGVEGIKADDGEGYYLPDDVRLADSTTGAHSAWRLGGLYRRSMQRALDEAHAGGGVLFGRCGWTGQQATGALWGGDQASDFWSLRALVAATVSAAMSGFSNWSHDVGGYLGERGVSRCGRELMLRWVQVGCFTPLMQAHGRLTQEPWTYDPETLALCRAYVVLHERLVPYVRAAAATCARSGVPIVRPASLLDPGDARAWSVADAFGYGPALWIAPVLEEGAREREVFLPRGEWIETWSGRRVTGGREVVAPAPLSTIPVWVRSGSIVVCYPAAHVAGGLGDTPESERPLEATLWGEPRAGRASARLADGTRIAWERTHGWRVQPLRDMTVTKL